MEVEKGMIFNIQDYSIHDGDGVRTIIFLSGCPLRCKWCSNPESQTLKKKLFYYRHKCIECNKCEQVCHKGLNPRNIREHSNNCDFCSACVNTCQNSALRIIGQEITAEDVLKIIEKDRLFFRFSGGGITFSGGEPFYQSGFLRKLVNLFYDSGINLWIETSGMFDFEGNIDIIKKLDHMFIDIKIMDENDHIKYTGLSNKTILENIIKINKIRIPITIRIPSIPGVNLTNDNIIKTAEFINDNLEDVEVELLPYHKLGKDKFIAMGNKEEDFISYRTPTVNEMNGAIEIFKTKGIKATWL